MMKRILAGVAALIVVVLIGAGIFLWDPLPGNPPEAELSAAAANYDAEVIRDDTGLPDESSRLLAVSLVGMAQVSARFWLNDTAGIDRADATALIAGLAWRGIRGYPKADEH